MKAILISVLVVIILIAGILLYRDGYVKRKLRKIIAAKYEIVAPLMKKLSSNETVTKDEILIMAHNPALRHGVYRALEVYDKSDLFPTEYFTREKGAEGFLVNWLEFPTELGSAPDAIELLTKVTVDENELLDYYVFKYKTNVLHRADTWMMGVSGPYRMDSLPFDVPLRVFSRFNIINSISPENEVQWVHENINKA